MINGTQVSPITDRLVPAKKTKKITWLTSLWEREEGFNERKIIVASKWEERQVHKVEDDVEGEEPAGYAFIITDNHTAENRHPYMTIVIFSRTRCCVEASGDGNTAVVGLSYSDAAAEKQDFSFPSP